MRKLLILSDCGERVPHLTDDFSVIALPVDADKRTRLMHLEDAEVIIGEPTLDELSQAKKLRWLQMTWAGADRYLKGGFPNGVTLTTASGAYGETIAEHALAMLFAMCRRLPAYIRENNWRDLGSEKKIMGSTALIFGCGDIGTAIAKRLKALGVQTIGVCRDLKKPRLYFDVKTNLTCAEAFLDKADFVLCALPHSSETEKYLNKERLTLLKDDAVIVNVGRGSFIDTDFLAELMQARKLFGAGLDVTETEPLPMEHPIWVLPNAIITPHVAGIGFGHLSETEEKIWSICRENISRYLKGEALRNVVKIP